MSYHSLDQLTEHISMERITAHRNNNISASNETWNAFLTHLNLKHNSPKKTSQLRDHGSGFDISKIWEDGL